MGSVPMDITFRMLSQETGECVDLKSSELFSGKKIVLFAVPGAFTPICSNNHLPSYMLTDLSAMTQKVDRVVCLSINDAWVMRAWAKDQKVPHDKILFLPDQVGEFTRGVGMTWHIPDLGGDRSDRYSMYVVDGVMKKVFREAP